MISKPSVESYYEDYARISYEKLQNSLYDPDSAKFSFMYTYVHENGIVVVTELNAKNQLGGYAGAKTYAFIWDGDYADVAETPYAEEWVDKCFDVAAEYYPLAVTWDVADF